MLAVYVASSGTNDIAVLELSPEGRVRLLERVALPARDRPGSSTPLAVSPDRRFLFAAVHELPYAVASYRIDAASGRLTYLGSGEVPASMVSLATDRAGRFLLSASYHQSVVAVNPIGDDGVVGPALQTIATAPKAHHILVSPSNRFVLHTSLGGDRVQHQRFDPTTGTLTPNDPPAAKVAPGAGPRHLVFAPRGDMVYLLNELDGSIYVFPYDDATGTLQPELQVASALPAELSGPPWAADIHITPDGRFLYASERTSSTLAAFRVDPARGTLSLIASYPTTTQPRAFAIDPSGRYLLAVGQVSNTLTCHAIDPTTGALSRLADEPVGSNPNWIEIVGSADRGSQQ